MITLEKWKSMQDVVLPWVGKETGYTVESIGGHCPACKGDLIHVRGNIYEAFGAIEFELAGACLKCKHLVNMRCRIYPKRSEFSKVENGQWVTYKMKVGMNKQAFWKAFRRAMRSSCSGMAIAIIVTMSLAKVTKVIYMCWGLIFVGLVIIAVILGLMASREEE